MSPQRNKSPEQIAVGADRSAVKVPPLSRHPGDAGPRPAAPDMPATFMLTAPVVGQRRHNDRDRTPRPPLPPRPAPRTMPLLLECSHNDRSARAADLSNVNASTSARRYDHHPALGWP
jgi:hypothetical protein